MLPDNLGIVTTDDSFNFEGLLPLVIDTLRPVRIGAIENSVLLSRNFVRSRGFVGVQGIQHNHLKISCCVQRILSGGGD